MIDGQRVCYPNPTAMAMTRKSAASIIHLLTYLFLPREVAEIREQNDSMSKAKSCPVLSCHKRKVLPFEVRTTTTAQVESIEVKASEMDVPQKFFAYSYCHDIYSLTPTPTPTPTLTKRSFFDCQGRRWRAWPIRWTAPSRM